MAKSLVVILISSCCFCSVISNEVCWEPKKPGPCKAAFPRYFYNTAICKCDKFYWGGCDPNGNNFQLLTDCQSACNDSLNNCVCQLPIKPHGDGPIKCMAFIPSFGFNTATCQCESFIYTGCGGNGNRFSSLVECQEKCYDVDCDTQSTCDLPADVGPCEALIPRYFYNKKTCQCELFNWGGCGGNGNNFMTMKDCMNSCYDADCDTQSTCGLPADAGFCKALIPRYFYNKNTCKCEMFNWGGCGGNDNKYLTYEDCVNTCDGYATCEPNPRQCYLPKDKGVGKALLERFYYDHLECKCKQFIYNGMQGNDNNFSSKRKCKKACRDVTCPICNLPRVPGPCKGSFMRYFYNITSCQCELFVYGGCGGNANRFESLEDCQGACGSLECPICNLPSSKGPCNGYLPRWYYDTKKCQCKEFSYSSCGGNMNRFLTESDCNGSCGGYSCPVCSLPKEVGSGSDAITRWFYSFKKDKCRKFTWRGGQSNGNNFRTRKQCNKACKGFAYLKG